MGMDFIVVIGRLLPELLISLYGFSSSLNDLSLKADVCLSVCMSCSSKVCLHRYLNSLIHQGCAVWTSQTRGRAARSARARVHAQV